MDNNETSYEETSSQAKAWIQENLRIIVSIFIVAAIALGIYSYSQRAEIASEDNDIAALLDTKGEETSEEASTETTPGEGMMADENQAMENKVVITEELSQETDSAFVEKAAKGDGTTHLARRALAHYLEKNTDSALTAEHKVFIEDYLRKNVGHSGWVNQNDSVSFSKDLIKQAIDHSKTLNEHQLQNLKKYSQNVSAYR